MNCGIEKQYKKYKANLCHGEYILEINFCKCTLILVVDEIGDRVGLGLCLGSSGVGWFFWAHLCNLHGGLICIAFCLSVCSLSVCSLDLTKKGENNSYLS